MTNDPLKSVLKELGFEELSANDIFPDDDVSQRGAGEEEEGVDITDAFGAIAKMLETNARAERLNQWLANLSNSLSQGDVDHAADIMQAGLSVMQKKTAALVEDLDMEMNHAGRIAIVAVAMLLHRAADTMGVGATTADGESVRFDLDEKMYLLTKLASSLAFEELPDDADAGNNDTDIGE